MSFTNPTTNNLGAPLLASNQAQKEVIVNEALSKIDALINVTILDLGINIPPTNPNEGDTYIVGATPVDEFINHENNIAYYNVGWRFITPNIGLTLWVQNVQATYMFDGNNWIISATVSGGNNIDKLNDLSDIEVANSSTDDIIKFDGTNFINSKEINNLSGLGINTTADITNKLIVRSDNVLFTTENDDCRIKLNKNSKNNITSFVFQSNWQGFAEFGLIANNDFSLKISADGSTFIESFVIDKNNAKIYFKQDIFLHGEAISADRVGDYKISDYGIDHDRWLLCDGRTISRSSYSSLFTVIGTKFGSGDGSTSFHLPSKTSSIGNVFIFSY